MYLKLLIATFTGISLGIAYIITLIYKILNLKWQQKNLKNQKLRKTDILGTRISQIIKCRKLQNFF